MKKDTISFNCRKIASVGKKRSRSSAWRKRSGDKKRRRRRSRTDFARKSSVKRRKKRKRNSLYPKELPKSTKRTRML